MLSLIVNYYKTNTAKDTTIVFAGTLINAVIGGLFFVVAPRVLGPADFGIFSTIVSTAILIITISNSGIDSGILKFATKNSPNFYKIISLAFKSYLILGISVAILGFFAAPAISAFLGLPQISGLLKLSLLGTIFILLTNFFTAALQAKGQFAKAAVVNILGNISRLVVLLLSVMFLELGLLALTLIFFLTPIISVIAGFFLFPVKIEKTHKSDFINFFKFNIWLALALVISSIPLDNYLLVKLSGPTQTGLYSAPFKLLTIAFMFGGNFTRVLASRFSAFDTKEKALTYVKKAAFIPLIFAIALILTIPVSPLITNLVLGEEFAGSAVVYQLLSIGFAFFFISTIPSSLIIYFLGKTKVSFIITALKYLVFTVTLLIFIPKYSAVGAAVAFSSAELFSLIIMSGFAWFRLKQ